jgi:DNA-binding beta-propeller fold protein YncE
VAEDGNNRIQKFDSNGVFITKWGSYGSGDGQFYHPQGVSVDSAGNVYVADTDNHRIQKFSQFSMRTVTKAGTGEGLYRAVPGISCGSDCTELY